MHNGTTDKFTGDHHEDYLGIADNHQWGKGRAQWNRVLQARAQENIISMSKSSFLKHESQDSYGLRCWNIKEKWRTFKKIPERKYESDEIAAIKNWVYQNEIGYFFG